MAGEADKKLAKRLKYLGERQHLAGSQEEGAHLPGWGAGAGWVRLWASACGRGQGRAVAPHRRHQETLLAGQKGMSRCAHGGLGGGF